MSNIPTIIIPEQNDFIYVLTIDGFVVSSSDNIHVYASSTPTITTEVQHVDVDGKIKIPFRNLKQGVYNLWVTYTVGGQKISYNYRDAFKIVPWNNHEVNWTDYKEGSEISVAAKVGVLITFEESDWESLWNTMAELESLKEECESAASEAHEAAEYAIQEGDAAKDAATAATTATTGAENVNATLSGTTLSVTDRDGVTTSVDTKGEKGDKGDTGEKGADGKDGSVLYPTFDINDNGHLIANVPTTEADLSVSLNDNGHLILTI